MINYGVCIKGEWNESDTLLEFYGLLQEVIDLDYEGHDKIVQMPLV
jgi:hypothetical protein